MAGENQVEPMPWEPAAPSVAAGGPVPADSSARMPWEEGGAKIQTATPAYEKAFPSTAEAIRKIREPNTAQGGIWSDPRMRNTLGLARIGLAVLQDAGTMEGRGYASASPRQEFGDPQSGYARGARENLQSATDEATKRIVSELEKDPSKMKYFTSYFKISAQEIPNFIGQALLSIAENPITGLLTTPIKGGQTLLGAMRGAPKVAAAASAVVPAAAALPKITGAVAKETSPIFRVAEQLTGVPAEALRLASTKPGREALEKHAGKLREYAEDLVRHLDDNPIASIPERAEVNAILRELPPTDASTIFEKMRGAKEPPGTTFTPAMEKANAQIDADIAGIAGGLRKISGAKAGQFFKTKLSAEDVYRLRQQLDDITDFSVYGLDTMGGRIVNNARLAGRKQLQQQLEELAKASGKPEYVTKMRSYAAKLDKLDDVKKMIGSGSNASREDRAASLLRRASNEEGETARKKLLQGLDDIFGEDFTTNTKLATLADALGPKGKATMFPRQTTGRALLALATGASATSLLVPAIGAKALPIVLPAAAALGSPKVLTRVTVPAARAAVRGAKKTAQFIKKAELAIEEGAAAPLTAAGQVSRSTAEKE